MKIQMNKIQVVIDTTDDNSDDEISNPDENVCRNQMAQMAVVGFRTGFQRSERWRRYIREADFTNSKRADEAKEREHIRKKSHYKYQYRKGGHTEERKDMFLRFLVAVRLFISENACGH
ncbi:hypothetical protein INT43_006701 [Umbelopsis isabellina]|uniref:Uncharacterized protein n=1 Tax=Mortierella isabellina TaxID=91625 RepID=A0A8H7Q0K0_MORIS|nr:hypothetical protein INT43_006701 [Umbelopsis isabellina]